jgi:hypothetical protein
MALDTNDLLYAHGCLCEYARNSVFKSRVEADHLCDTINHLQRELRPFLKPETYDFISCFVYPLNRWIVYPIGGW